MNGASQFASGIASERRHFALARSPQFATRLLRHHGSAPDTGLGPHRFVYLYSRPRRESFTLRIMAPLQFSQTIHAPINRWEERRKRFASLVFNGPTSVWHTGFTRLESIGPKRQWGVALAHRLQPAVRSKMTMSASSPVQQSDPHHHDSERSTLAVRGETFHSLLPSSTRHGPSPLAASTRFERRLKERDLVRFAPPATRRGGACLAGSTTASRRTFASGRPPNAPGLAQPFFTSRATAPVTFLNSRPISSAVVFLPASTRFETLTESFPVSLALVRGNTGASHIPDARLTVTTAPYPAVLQSFAMQLPGASAARELRLATAMVLSTRPEQVLATSNTTYVFAQAPRPAALEPQRSFGSDRQEIVHLVQKEIRSAMNSGAVVASFTRHDFASITDQIESLLKRRLLVEKERLGLPPG